LTPRKHTSKKKINDGKSYEMLVEKVVAGLLLLHGEAFRNVKVQRDVRLNAITPGRSGKPLKPQVDVYWEFEVGGVDYRTVIQCKDWDRKVSLGAVDTFKNVLADLPGQPRGVLITKAGCQSGALDYAKAHGIAVYQLKEADAELWGGQIPQLSGTVSMSIIKTVSWRVLSEQKPSRRSQRTRKTFEAPLEDIKVFDEAGTLLGTLQTLADSLKEAWLRDAKLRRGVNVIACKGPYKLENSTGDEMAIDVFELTIDSQPFSETVTLNKTFTHVLHLVTGKDVYTVDTDFAVKKLGETLTATIFEQNANSMKTLEEIFDEAKADEVTSN
jgi:hypothetical protein